MKPLTFVLAPDSFKESMTAKEVCVAMELGLRKIFPNAQYVRVPMADGGEGTTQSLIDASNGQLFSKQVTGPLGNIVQASYGLMGDQKTAVIEMAEASGLYHVPRDQRNPLVTTSYGTGELILACLDLGVNKIILGIGGSATNDGGAGMAEALGVKLYDSHHHLLSRGGGALDKLQFIDISDLDPRLKHVEFIVACDVDNILCGEQGASMVFGPQKGASPEMVQQLDHNLHHYGKILQQQLQKDVMNVSGSGAAGGVGAGLLAFTNAKLQKGIDIVVEYSGLREKLKNADYCLTGEGRIDFQTQFGKTPYGVAQIAKEQSVPVIAICGSIGEGAESLYEKGIDAIFSIIPANNPLDIILRNGAKNMEQTCENIGRLLKLCD